jgi:hypothetical protein
MIPVIASCLGIGGIIYIKFTNTGILWNYLQILWSILYMWFQFGSMELWERRVHRKEIKIFWIVMPITLQVYCIPALDYIFKVHSVTGLGVVGWVEVGIISL